MSRLITVPAPLVACATDDGVSSYRIEIVSLAVAQRDDGTAALSLRIGDATAQLELDPDVRAHLAEQLRGVS